MGDVGFFLDSYPETLELGIREGKISDPTWCLYIFLSRYSLLKKANGL